MAKLFDKTGNLTGKGELQYIKANIDEGEISHTLINSNTRLLWFTKNGKFVNGALNEAYIGKAEYELIKNMVGIVEGK